MYMFVQDIEIVSLPSFFCQLLSVPCPYPGPPPCLVILQSGLLPSSKEHNPPQALQSCGQREQSKGDYLSKFHHYCSCGNIHKIWGHFQLGCPENMVVGVWRHVIIACYQIYCSLLWKAGCIFMGNTSATVENANSQLRKQTNDKYAPLLLGHLLEPWQRIKGRQLHLQSREGVEQLCRTGNSISPWYPSWGHGVNWILAMHVSALMLPRRLA